MAVWSFDAGSSHFESARVVTYHGVAAEHALMTQPIRKFIHSRLAQLTHKRADAVVTVDRKTPERAARLFGVNPQDFVYVPNGVPQPHQQIVRQAGLANTLMVAHVGAIDVGKGWKITAQAVDVCRAQGKQIQLVIAGAGPEKGIAERWCVERPSYCRFLGWVNDINSEVFNKIDALIMPSESEGMPMAALEALAAGVPVIATKVGGFPDIIGD